MDDSYCQSMMCVESLCASVPLTVTPSAATFDCSGPGVALSASGGVPPYSWTTSAGDIVGGGASVTLVAPPNPGAGLGGVAYSIWDGPTGGVECSGGHSTCGFGWACIQPGGLVRSYSCSGAFLGGGGCGVWDCVGFGPECPIDCATYAAETMADRCGPAGVPRDQRSDEMVAGRCNPCALAMGGGALVTVTDSAGHTATATIGF